MRSLQQLRTYFLSLLRRALRLTAVEAAAAPRPSTVYTGAEGGLTHAQHISAEGQRVLDVAGPTTGAVNRPRSVASATGQPARLEATGDDLNVDLALRPQGAAGSIALQSAAGTTVLAASAVALGINVPVLGTYLLATSIADGATVTPTTALRLSHTTSGTAATGFGVRSLYQLDNAVHSLEEAGALDCVWTDAGDGTEASAFVFYTRTGGGALAETVRVLPGGQLQLTGSDATIQALTAGADIRIVPGGGGDVIVDGNLEFSDLAPTIRATGADQGIALVPNGTGNVELRGSSGTAVVTVDTDGTDRLGFFGVGPVAQGALVNDAAGGVTVDAEARTAINTLLARLRDVGLIAT